MGVWADMGEPVLLIARVAMVVLVGLQLRRAIGRARRAREESRRRTAEHGRSRVGDRTIVSLYNDALLLGWPADERATFDEVARRAGSSVEHVRTVVDTHRAA
jgi:hypothetical protein